MRDLVDLGPGRDPGKHAYVIELEALGDKSTVVSGTLALFSADARYDIPFAAALALGTTDKRPPGTIVVRLPSSVRLERGYVATLRNPDVARCLPLTREVRPSPVGPRMPTWFVSLLERSQDVHMIDSPAPRKEALARCDQQDRAASAKRLAEPAAPPQVDTVQPSGDGSLDVPVVVVLSDDGSVLSARPARPSRWPALDAAAVEAARQSAYQPQIVRCRPEGGEYLVVITYTRSS